MLKRILKSILRRAPWLGIYAVSLIRPIQFRRERAAFSGQLKQVEKENPSIVYFSHYRCASMMINKRLLQLIAEGNYQQLDYQGYVHPWPIEEREAFQRDCSEHEKFGRFPITGHYFGPLRYYVDIPGLEKMKVIVVLRDPRDVLVSRYFSEKYNHVRLDNRFKKHCETISKLSLDEFVLQFKEDVGAHYEFYQKNSDKLKNALFINYEEMIADFHGFLDKVNTYVGLGLSEQFLKELASQESFSVKSENFYSHKRSVQARNFEKKLQQETIADLNRYFSEILSHYGWEK